MRWLDGVIECCRVDNRLGIKKDEISGVASSDQSTPRKPESMGGHSSHL